MADNNGSNSGSTNSNPPIRDTNTYLEKGEKPVIIKKDKK